MAHKVRKNDAQIQRDVQRELEWDAQVDAADVGVAVDEGVVTLTGTVPNSFERHAALAAAFRVAGVRDVANEIDVNLPGHAIRTDTEIAKAVRHTLSWDVSLDEDRIQSTVSDGWVSLAGEADSWDQSQDAELAVRRLQGVRGVLNGLTVRRSTEEPTEVKRAIEKALERRSARERERIKVEIRDGIITLSGTVGSGAERRDAVETACHALGTYAVRDELRIEPPRAAGREERSPVSSADHGPGKDATNTDRQ